MDSNDNDAIIKKYKLLQEQKAKIEEEINDIETEYFTEAKIYKSTLYFIDVNCEYGGNPFDYIENKFPAYCFNVEQRSVMWHDDIDINKCNATKETYDSYFDK